ITNSCCYVNTGNYYVYRASQTVFVMLILVIIIITNSCCHVNTGNYYVNRASIEHHKQLLLCFRVYITSLWRCHAASTSFSSIATWRIHTHDKHGNHLPLGTQNSNSTLTRMARRASFLKRRFSSTKFMAPLERQESFNSLTSVPSSIKQPGTPQSSHGRIQEQSDGGVDEADMENYQINKPELLTEDHKKMIRVIRKIRFFVARRKFQQARKPYDVRDVIEQYSQGHLNMMVRIKELQRRLDQTIGKPLYLGNGRDKDRQTLCYKISQLENQINRVDRKMDQTLTLLNILVENSEDVKIDSGK
ncbi:hypothetical protein ACJMK2_027717, partial [Sinanodonta woodiana]